MTLVNSSTELSLTRHIRAPRSVVFAAWTTPELIRRWFTPGDMTPSAAEADVRVGGRYRIVLNGTNCAGDHTGEMVATGEYTAVVPDRKLQFTWTNAGRQSLVTVELLDAGDGTELRLTHTGLADAADVERHARGWNSILDKISGSYAKLVEIAAAPDKVLAAVTTAAGVAGWWNPASGNPGRGEELLITFPNGFVRLRVEQARPPQADGKARVHWLCTACDVVPDWEGTRIEFDLAPGLNGNTQLAFQHNGLTPALPCFDMCERGWDRYLPSLKAYAETGIGFPNQTRRSA